MARTQVKKISMIIKHLGGRSGGAERVYCEQANFLSEHGYEVSCVVFDPPGDVPFFRLNPKVELVQLGGEFGDWKTACLKSAFKVLPKGLRFRDRVRWHAMNRDYVNQLRRYFRGAKPDLAISLLPPANTPTLIAARDLDIKVIVTNHNVPKEDYTNPERWGGGAYDRALRLSTLDRADGIHVLFPKFGAWFPKRLHERIFAIPNYISDEILQPVSAGCDRSHVILGVGRLAPVKNYLALLDAWARLGDDRKDWQVHLFGTGPQEKQLRAKISELGLETSFKLMGVTQNITLEYLDAAILCHPALFEGFGLSPAEALACGTPVLAYADTPGIDEFLVHGKNAFLVDRNGDAVQNLAAGLRELMTDHAWRKSLGDNGPASVARFDKQTHVNRWIQAIENVVSEREYDQC